MFRLKPKFASKRVQRAVEAAILQCLNLAYPVFTHTPNM